MKPLYIKDEPNYVRDAETGAIVMVNDAQCKSYIAQRKRVADKNAELERQGNEINNLKKDISDIKDMLISLLNRNQ